MSNCLLLGSMIKFFNRYGLRVMFTNYRNKRVLICQTDKMLYNVGKVGTEI